MFVFLLRNLATLDEQNTIIMVGGNKQHLTKVPGCSGPIDDTIRLRRSLFCRLNDSQGCM
jgi:hypothetical protein